jgi:hypothetical protein
MARVQVIFRPSAKHYGRARVRMWFRVRAMIRSTVRFKVGLCLGLMLCIRIGLVIVLGLMMLPGIGNRAVLGLEFELDLRQGLGLI